MKRLVCQCPYCYAVTRAATKTGKTGKTYACGTTASHQTGIYARRCQ
jgi:hypothetical protein